MPFPCDMILCVSFKLLTLLHSFSFARAQLKCLVAAIVGRYEIRITRNKSKYYPAGIYTTKAANGMWLQFDEVEGW
jgi:hypothetical protein